MQAAVLQSDHQLHLHLTLTAHYPHASSYLCSLLNKDVNGIPWNFESSMRLLSKHCENYLDMTLTPLSTHPECAKLDQ